ncbi:hypothetical protein L6164_030666 [Bauhinia variegata]|uniref:Uncharacterized protein n=1 Tax=Bauhinia variegata TaxID=167791 RepID=A0ACB9LCX6_BAUVA|nr:hypothetical protein L6164_030666 [Bauhinia variegata]
MVWPIRSKIGLLFRSTAALAGSSIHGDSSWCLPFPVPTKFVGSSVARPPSKSMKWPKPNGSRAALLPSVRENQLEVPSNGLKLSREYSSLDVENMIETHGGQEDLFGLIKQRFLSFKQNQYTKELKHFESLAEAQFPKFMVIACADSRVCPSNILGFQPGDAFMIRNIANLVPPLKDGPSECNAALEFAVTTLKVENILVVGHSRCAGIENLMNMQEEVESSSFIHKWIANGKDAKLITKAAAAHLSFSQQCKFCEKESINQSLLNLLTYPWIEDKETMLEKEAIVQSKIKNSGRYINGKDARSQSSVQNETSHSTSSY